MNEFLIGRRRRLLHGPEFGRCRLVCCWRMCGVFITWGRFFALATRFSLEKLYLAGITGYPPQKMIAKTALGAEQNGRVGAECGCGAAGFGFARDVAVRFAAIETSVHAVDLFEWQPRFPVCVVFGHETEGLTAEVGALADTHVRIPDAGAEAFAECGYSGWGGALCELLRKYRALSS